MGGSNKEQQKNTKVEQQERLVEPWADAHSSNSAAALIPSSNSFLAVNVIYGDGLCVSSTQL